MMKIYMTHIAILDSIIAITKAYQFFQLLLTIIKFALQFNDRQSSNSDRVVRIAITQCLASRDRSSNTTETEASVKNYLSGDPAYD